MPKKLKERISWIRYGEPAGSEKLIADLKARRIVLRGSCITGDNPIWECLERETYIYRK